MGHEYCGIAEAVGSAVKTIKPGQFVIGSFFASENTCAHCHAGYQTSCEHREFVGGAQARCCEFRWRMALWLRRPTFPKMK
jgi:threonine dehydrogenase-like Zn-dependent dehydrogenase